MTAFAIASAPVSYGAFEITAFEPLSIALARPGRIGKIRREFFTRNKTVTSRFHSTGQRHGKYFVEK